MSHTESSTGRRLSIAELPVYNALHGDEHDNEALVDHDDDEHDEHEAHGAHKYHNKREIQESFDFNDVESMMWKKVCVYSLYYSLSYSYS
jgi:hypothetical protein